MTIFISILAYILSIVAFYITYFISSFLFLFPLAYVFYLLKLGEYKREGRYLVVEAFFETFLSFLSILFVFRLLGVTPNWWVLTPLSILLWFYFTRAFYGDERFGSGAAHWGMLIGVIVFLTNVAK